MTEERWQQGPTYEEKIGKSDFPRPFSVDEAAEKARREEATRQELSNYLQGLDTQVRHTGEMHTLNPEELALSYEGLMKTYHDAKEIIGEKLSPLIQKMKNYFLEEAGPRSWE